MGWVQKPESSAVEKSKASAQDELDKIVTEGSQCIFRDRSLSQSHLSLQSEVEKTPVMRKKKGKSSSRDDKEVLIMTPAFDSTVG